MPVCSDITDELHIFLGRPEASLYSFLATAIVHYVMLHSFLYSPAILFDLICTAKIDSIIWREIQCL
jgi:hypothetical protein